MTLRVYLFGNFSLMLDGAPLATARWTYRKSHQLLKLLALQPGLQIHKDQVIELFWPDAPVKLTSANLYRTIHYLRRALESDIGRVARSRFVELRGGIIRLRAEADVWVDVHEFDSLLARARTAASPAPLLEAAVKLHRGPLLYDDLYEEWTQAPRTLYEERYVAALHALVQHYRSNGADAQLVEAARRIVQVDATDEVTQRQLMLAYARMGRRSEALRQYDQLAQTLAAELGSTPSAETIALSEQIRSGRALAAQKPVYPAAPTHAGLRTPITSLIGRDVERAAVAETLLRPAVRLLTLTGVPGVGKSSLALDVARELRPHFAHGAAMVDLAPLNDPAALLPAVVAAVGAEEQGDRPPLDVLRSHLADRELLLVLDNVEHLIAAAHQIGALLASAPDLTVLATSRRVLNLTGEHVYGVPPLPLPDRPFGSFADLARVPSVALFVARAQAAQHDFVLTDANAASVAAICIRLDGLPLAIELAAARVRHMPPATILGQLDRRLPILSGGPRDGAERHSSLRGALAWSLRQLSPAAQQIFARTGVFAGGFTLRLARAVMLDDPPPATADPGTELLRILGELVDCQLIQLDPAAADEPRYHMLETLSEYAMELLEQRGEVRLRRDRHAAAVAALVAELKPRLLASPDAMDAIDRELDNIRAALRWMIEHGPAGAALALANDLGQYWYIGSRLREGEESHRPSGIATMITTIAVASGRRDQEIVRLLGAAHAMSEPAGEIDTFPLGHAWFERYLDELRRELGDAFATAWDQGRAMSRQAALAAVQAIAPGLAAPYRERHPGD